MKFKLLESKKDIQNFIDLFGEDTYKQFVIAKNKGKFKNSCENDVYYWIKKYKYDVDKAKQFIDCAANLFKSNTEIRKGAKNGAKKVFENDTWVVYHILTPEASQYYGKGTRWCISGTHAKDWWKTPKWYDQEGWIGCEYYFYINKKDGSKYAVCSHIDEDDEGNYYEVFDETDFMIGNSPWYIPDAPDYYPPVPNENDYDK